MSDWQPQIVRIENVRNHPDAYALDIVTVLGDYPIVVKRDEYKVGDLAGYISIDSIVPDTNDFYFLCPRLYEKYEDENGQLQQRQLGPKYPVGSVPEKYRIIKAKKIRGIYSQGILVNIEYWMAVHYITGEAIEGQPIDGLIGLKKWEEEEEEENLPGLKKKTGTNAEKAPQGWAMPHYDIDGIRKYLACLQDNEQIVLTEKIHGCVKHDTRIYYLNGVKKPISQVKEGDVLLGVDAKGKIVPSIVQHKFNNGRSDNWIKITGTRNGCGRGNNSFSITCTDEHRFYSPSSDCYVRAHELQIGDVVSVLRTDYSLTPVQEQVLLGKMLGDASISIHSECSALITWGHAEEYQKYVEWTRQGIGSLDSGVRENYVSGYGTKMVRARTVSTNLIKEKFASFIVDDKKVVPEWVADDLTPLSIAFWYMDDGSLGHTDDQEDRASFAVCEFSKKDCQVLQRGLAKFGIDAVFYCSRNKKEKEHSRLRLNAESAERLFLLITPYVPEVMQYKLPERYRNHIGWLPSSKEYKQPFVEQTILAIEPLDKVKSFKYDLETSTHNYIANGILVHNSNGGFSHDGNRLFVKSRNYYKKQDEDDMWWDIALRYDLEKRLAQFPGLVFFGEVVGQVKGFRYDSTIENGRLMTTVHFFDIWDTKNLKYLDYDERVAIIKATGLNPVPELYRGAWKGKELMYPYAEGMSTLNPKHIREGWVLNTVKERYEPKLDSRMQVKLVGEGYNLQK